MGARNCRSGVLAKQALAKPVGSHLRIAELFFMVAKCFEVLSQAFPDPLRGFRPRTMRREA